MKSILDYLSDNPGSKSFKIANDLNLEKKTVNSFLYGKLSSKVYQNKKYEWFLVGSNNKINDSKISQKKTQLSKLADYFLESTIQDTTRDIRVFAKSKFDYDYAEFETFPLIGFDNISEIISKNINAQNLLSRVKKETGRKTLYLGYPNRLSKIKSKNNIEYFFIEPIFYFMINAGEDGNLNVDDYPNLNSSFIKNISQSQGSGTLEEILQLYDELGLDDSDNVPDIEDIFLRLQVIRPEWDWIEKIDPEKKSEEIAFKNNEKIGIFNKALLIYGDKSVYTQNLEKELDKLKYISEDEYIHTSLGKIVNNNFRNNKPQAENMLLEPIPLNNEQRKAVNSALNNEITVITGPPGTGKSQVVTTLLINAAWENKKVLFASKNNKAVDVVEARVNALSSSPILLRHGRNVQRELSEHLTNLLSIDTTDEDKQIYQNLLDKHNELNSIRNSLGRKEIEIINSRNEFDTLDRKIENELKELDTNKKDFIEKYQLIIDRYKDKSLVSHYKKTLEKLYTLKNKGGIGIYDWFTSNERIKSLRNIIQLINKDQIDSEIKIPSKITNSSIEKLIVKIRKKISLFSLIDEILDHPKKLIALLKLGKLEDVAINHKNLIDELQDNSLELWKSHLKVSPTKLTQEERKALNDYAIVLEMVTSNLQKNEKISSQIWRKYYDLFPDVISALPCWAITSLSATRIPYEANYFDLLVIDEASQCDIASAIPLMYRAKNIVVIGDPKQLKHISTIRKNHDQKIMNKYGLLETHIGWSYSHTSLFDLCRGYCTPESLISLRDHHRSHSQIINFSNMHFYQENLRVATKHENLKTLKDKLPAVRWIDVEGESIKHPSGGSYNIHEIDKIINFLEDLIFKKNYEGSIGITTPFREHANKIRIAINKNKNLEQELLKNNYICDTVHKFQGDERDLMIFSPVLSKNMADGSINFLKSNGNLFNVAITRARGALILIGDHNKCINSKVSYISQFAKYTSDLQYESKKNEDFEVIDKDMGPNYPTVMNPESVSDWEKIFYEKLYEEGIRTIPQFNIDQYRLDLALIREGKKLNIEIDGERYHKNWDGDLCLRDRLRNLRLIELGWDVKRFWVYEVRDNIENCVDDIKKWLK
jgi:superfamily I DNA and/or RNA helicase/very-short-patch-repair endonuclease